MAAGRVSSLLFSRPLSTKNKTRKILRSSNFLTYSWTMNNEIIDGLYAQMKNLTSENFALRNKLAVLSGYLGADKTNPNHVNLSVEIKKLLEEAYWLSAKRLYTLTHESKPTQPHLHRNNVPRRPRLGVWISRPPQEIHRPPRTGNEGGEMTPTPQASTRCTMSWRIQWMVWRVRLGWRHPGSPYFLALPISWLSIKIYYYITIILLFHSYLSNI